MTTPKLCFLCNLDQYTTKIGTFKISYSIPYRKSSQLEQGKKNDLLNKLESMRGCQQISLSASFTLRNSKQPHID